MIDAIRSRMLQAEIVVVVSNRKAAYGLERAEAAGIPTRYHPLKPYRDAGRHARSMTPIWRRWSRNMRRIWVVLAGWMHILSNAFLRPFSLSRGQSASGVAGTVSGRQRH